MPVALPLTADRVIQRGLSYKLEQGHHWRPGGDLRAKGLLKAELKRRNVGYRELAEKLTAMGIPETERNLANKISRGGFTAAFFLQCLVAIGVVNLRLSE